MMLGVIRVRKVVPLSCHPEGPISRFAKGGDAASVTQNQLSARSLRRRRFGRRGIVVLVGIRS